MCATKHQYQSTGCKHPPLLIAIAAILSSFWNCVGLLRSAQSSIIPPIVVPKPHKSKIHVTGPFPYVGGKSKFSSQILPLFPPHKTYVEPFSGGAHLLFRKPPSPVEVLNDLDGEVVNFFRIVQAHPDELVRTLQGTLASRKWFSLFRSLPPEALTDVQRAARFFYLQKNSFAGLRVNQTYHYHIVKTPSFDPGRLSQLFDKFHKRLQRVQIECLPYEQILEKFDSQTTFFFLDPPYWGRKLYAYNFNDDQFAALEERLRRLRGKFVLSLNDVPEVRSLFGTFHQTEIRVPYTAQRQAGKRFSELLITNFSPRPVGQQYEDA